MGVLALGGMWEKCSVPKTPKIRSSSLFLVHALVPRRNTYKETETDVAARLPAQLARRSGQLK
jgi:hypothetical protein